MADVNEHVIEEAGSRGETLLATDLIRLIERYDTGPGVPQPRLNDYVEFLGDNGFDEETLRSGLDQRVTDSRSWTDEESIYELENGDISAYPQRWHDELAGVNDIASYVAVMTTDPENSEDAYQSGGIGEGVPEGVLVKAATVFGDYDYDLAKGELDKLRKEGYLGADADQHPSARILLTEKGRETLEERR
ncbi:hypothetical protein ACNS7O_09185 [Haloferacaceae archaeon DSL9]